MSRQIRVRRSGLITFAIKLASTLTGFAFIVLVTSNLSQSDFGLWQLISRLIGYVIFPANLLAFWTTRYRARGIILGKSVLVAATIFSAALLVCYLILSYFVSGSLTTQAGTESNFYYFLISTPQVPLYIFAGVIEAILWGSVPERASFGFGIFEIAKVIIGAVTVAVFHLSLTGAIIAIMGAQMVQIITTLIMTPSEYGDHFSFAIISKMVRTGWVALLSQLQPLVNNFDFLIVAIITGSTIPLALFGAAFTYGAIVSYSNWIAFGLYAGILAGVDPKKSANQVLELQYLFTIPLVIGEILLAFPLLHLFKADYTQAVPILIILAVAYALNSFSLTFDNIISGTDITDVSNRVDFSLYLKSKIFQVARINIVITAAYLVILSISTLIISSGPVIIFGYQKYTFIGIIWAIAALGMWSAGVALKLPYVTKITKLRIPARNAVALLAGTVGFTFVLFLLTKLVTIHGGEVMQAIYIIGIGATSLAVYGGIIFLISHEMRSLAKQGLASLFG
ncbi:MAG: hypothetical protein OK439_01645 [Thaumarchaeota archaeon]|nr:hypothetical protein [Nitrososphaerota archaeon]